MPNTGVGISPTRRPKYRPASRENPHGYPGIPGDPPPGTDLLGFGVSAISQVDDAYAQNHLDFPSYYRAIDEGEPPTAKGYRLSVDDRLRRYIIMRLMCDLTLKIDDVERHFGIDFWTRFTRELRELKMLEKDELVEISTRSIRITPRGRLLIRNVAMVFDAYSRPGRGAGRYSQTV